MRFELVSDKAKATRQPPLRPEKITFPCMPGKTVCYHQPLYKQALVNLQAAIHDSCALGKLKNRFYRIESNNGYISEVYPAVEYYKIAFRMIQDNLHTIMIAQNEINQSIRDIQKEFRDKKEQLPSGQLKISFDKEIYKIRSDIFTFTFSARAALDTIASVFQTIYGPEIGQYVSFNSLLKRFLKDDALIDKELSTYLRKNLEWFNLLKDVRDYLAHFGALHFTLKEQHPAPVTIEIFRNIEVSFFVSEVQRGFHDLLKYFDEHCTMAVKNT